MAPSLGYIDQSDQPAEDMTGSLRESIRACHHRLERDDKSTKTKLADLENRNNDLVLRLQGLQELFSTHTKDVLARVSRLEDPQLLSTLEARVHRIEDSQLSSVVDGRFDDVQNQIENQSMRIDGILNDPRFTILEAHLGRLDRRVDESDLSIRRQECNAQVNDLREQVDGIRTTQSTPVQEIAQHLLQRIDEVGDMDTCTVDELVAVLTNVSRAQCADKRSERDRAVSTESQFATVRSAFPDTTQQFMSTIEAPVAYSRSPTLAGPAEQMSDADPATIVDLTTTRDSSEIPDIPPEAWSSGRSRKRPERLGMQDWWEERQKKKRRER